MISQRSRRSVILTWKSIFEVVQPLKNKKKAMWTVHFDDGIILKTVANKISNASSKHLNV